MPTLSELRDAYREGREHTYKVLSEGYPRWSCPRTSSYEDTIADYRNAIKRKGMGSYKILLNFTKLMVMKACKSTHTLTLNTTNYHPDGTPYYSYNLTPTKAPPTHDSLTSTSTEPKEKTPLMEINVTRFMHDLGDTWHNQVNLGYQTSSISWNEALEATRELEPLSPEEIDALIDYFLGMGVEDVPTTHPELSAMLRQELRILQIEYDPDSPEDGVNALFKADDNQWYLTTI